MGDSDESRVGIITFINPLDSLDGVIEIFADISDAKDSNSNASVEVYDASSGTRKKLSYKPWSSPELKYQPAKIVTSQRTFVASWYQKAIERKG
jgi:hypothetical protein